MTYGEILRRHLEEADDDKDGFLDSSEWLAYLNKGKSSGKEDKEKKKLDERRYFYITLTENCSFHIKVYNGNTKLHFFLKKIE